MLEDYFEAHSIAFERLPESSRSGERQPDYRVKHGGVGCVFEVKELDEADYKDGGKYPITPPIREKIFDARQQFKLYRDSPCAVVLYTASLRRSVETTSVMSAAFGRWARFPDHLDKALAYRFHRDAALTSDSNTRISAVIALQHYSLSQLSVDLWKELSSKRERGEEITPSDQFDLMSKLSPHGTHEIYYQGTIRVVVLENPHAKIPFPDRLFVGAFDQRWRLQGDAFRLCFLGSELEKLRDRGVAGFCCRRWRALL